MLLRESILEAEEEGAGEGRPESRGGYGEEEGRGVGESKQREAAGS